MVTRIRVPSGARILVLEDNPERHHYFRLSLAGTDLRIATTTAAFEREIRDGVSWDLIFLDHDLDEAGDARTGLDAAVSMAAWDASIGSPTVIIHSMNPTGAQRMLRALEGEGKAMRIDGYRTWRVPFAYLELEVV